MIAATPHTRGVSQATRDLSIQFDKQRYLRPANRTGLIITAGRNIRQKEAASEINACLRRYYYKIEKVQATVWSALTFRRLSSRHITQVIVGQMQSFVHSCTVRSKVIVTQPCSNNDLSSHCCAAVISGNARFVLLYDRRDRQTWTGP
jgi:hypothetical protein